MYLSNVEKEALQLTGFGDVPPWAVKQGLEQALAKATYIPGEEALRLRLADALDLEERLAEQQASEQELQESGDVAIGDLAFAAAYNEMASHVVEGFKQGLVAGIEAHQEVAGPSPASAGLSYTCDPAGDIWPHVEDLATDGQMLEPSGLYGGETDSHPTTAGQEAAEEPPTGQWRSPLEIVTEGAEEAPQEAPGEQDAAPAAAAQRIEDRDFSSFTKAQLLAFAQDHFGVRLSRQDSKDDLIATVQGFVDMANEKVV